MERAAETRTATPEQLDNAISRFWWTRELTPWRRALFEATLGKFVSETWSDDFDAVVVIRQEVAPTLDPWK